MNRVGPFENWPKARPGAIFKLRVNRPVIIGETVVIPVGTPAFGRVESATDAGGLGKSGRMTARLLHVRLGDVDIPLTGQIATKGKGAGSTGVALLLGGVWGFFHRGNNAKIKAGEIMSGFVAADVTLDRPLPAAATTSAGRPAAPAPAAVP